MMCAGHQVELKARRDDFLVMSRVRKPKGECRDAVSVADCTT